MYHMHLIGGRSFTFDRASFGPGSHSLAVIITTDNGGRVVSHLGFTCKYTLMKISVIGLYVA